MTTIVPVEPGSPQREPPQRSSADFGAAITHRDMVREKLRVDPPSLAQKKLKSNSVRQNDPPRDRPGQYIDIEV
jgi:hypothetical protein